MIFSNVAAIQNWRKRQSHSVGFVPTMGALHEGHLSLVRKSLNDNGSTCISIFVNPSQFNDPNDLKHYPRTLERDIALLKSEGLTEQNAIFFPHESEIYSDNYRFKVTENNLSKKFCGTHRPGHFDGVLTVVLKLFQIIQPERAYFGEKDFQQLTLIQDLCKAFFIPVSIVPCPTQRTAEGLALSSRNERLSANELSKASLFPKILKTSPTASEASEKLTQAGFSVDYVEDWNNRRLGAVHLNHVRLIDNVPLT